MSFESLYCITSLTERSYSQGDAFYNTKAENERKYFQLFSIQGNLSIADMLYSGHIFIADTFSRNQVSQTTVKLIYFEPIYSGHLSIADTFSENQ